MPHVRPRAARLFIIVLAALSAALMICLGGSKAQADHLPPSPSIRAVLGVGWLALQAASLVGVYVASVRGFAALCALTSAIGIAAMAFGRGGMSALPVALLFVAPVALVCASAAMWLALRSATVTDAHRPWRLFVWLTCVGLVYLFATVAREAEAQVSSMAVAMAACGIAALCWPSLLRTVRVLVAKPTGTLSVWVWFAAIVLLLINGWVVQHNGLSTPQISIGRLSIAPYFLAGGLALFAVSLDCEAARTKPWTAALRIVLGLTACAAIYMTMMHEGGTLAAVLVGVLAVGVIAGPPRFALAAIVILFAAQLVLQNPAVIETIRAHAPRVGDRLLVWTNRAQPPSQMLRVEEAARLSGASGQMGAARLQFLVGPQLSKDYMPTQIMVQGGWLGLALVMLATILLAAELYSVTKRTQAPIARAAQNAVLALLLGNLLVTTLWLGDVTPFVGVPLPVLARAGSHLLVLTLVLLAFDITSQSDRATRVTGA